MEGSETDPPTTRVTRDVEPSALPDLLDSPRWASVAFVDAERIDVLPVAARCHSGTYRFGVRPGATSDLDGREVVLVIDDGPYWFQLRGISPRGIAKRVEPSESEAAGTLTWYVLEPSRILAWDYGTIREE